jgi:hypothetical protein
MKARGPLAVVVLLALLAGGGALLLLHGSSDEAAPAAAPRPADATPAPAELPDATPAANHLTSPTGSTPSAAPIDTSGGPAAAVGRAVDRAGRGVEGAKVTSYFRDDDPPFRSRRPLPIEQTTGADGRFRLTGLPEDKDLGLEIFDDGHAPGQRETFRVKPGADTDLGEIVLEEGFTLHGTVFGADRQVLVGATIALSDVTAQMGRKDAGPTRSATTDTNGDYSMAHLGPRQYSIEASAPGYGATGVVLSLVFGGLPTEWRQDFNLERADSKLGGWILGPDELGVADAPLTLTRQQGGGNAYFLLHGKTATDGHFAFDSVPAGVYQLQMDGPTHFFDRPADVTAPREDIMLHAQAALGLHGKVVGDAPVAGFHLAIVPDGRSGAGLVGDGPLERNFPGDSFDLGGLRPGSYRFEILAPGYAPTSSSDVIIASGQQGTEVLVNLLRGGTITGRLRPPAANARIELRDSDWDPAGPIESTFPTPATHGLVTSTGADGTFRLENVPPETYVLTARPPGAPPIHVRGVEARDRETTDVGSLEVQHGGTIFGNVVGPDGRVKAAVKVAAASSEHQVQATSDAQGGFRFEALPPGDYTLTATPGNLWEALRFSATATVTVKADQELGVELTLVERQQQPPR